MRKLLAASLLFAGTVFAQNFSNGNVTTIDARAGVARAIGSGSGWYAWEAPVAENVSICCWSKGSGKNCCGACALGSGSGWNMNIDDDDNDFVTGGGSMVVAVRIEDGGVDKVHMLNSTCTIDARGHSVRWLANVDPARSIEFLAAQARTAGGHDKGVMGALATHEHPNTLPALERLAARGEREKVREDAVFWIGQRGGERGFQFLRNLLQANESTSLRKKAVFSLSQNKSGGAIPELIALARGDESREIRREAIFWLGQRAGEKAAGELRRVVDEDPDEDVREHAVFAISQLPHDRSVPLLIDLARNHKSAGVRKKAMFWLVQTGDDRAIALIEEILTK